MTDKRDYYILLDEFHKHLGNEADQVEGKIKLMNKHFDYNSLDTKDDVKLYLNVLSIHVILLRNIARNVWNEMKQLDIEIEKEEREGMD